MAIRSDGPDSTVLSVAIPYYGSIALSILPRFLEAIEAYEKFAFGRLRKIEFNPARDDVWPDPDKGVATFYFYDQRIVFTVKYRPGEEGTRGSIDKIHTIELISGDSGKSFYYL